MSAIHPLVFAERIAPRLGALQDALDRLESLLPHRRMSKQAKREFHHIQSAVMHLVLDARYAKPEVTSALERQYPDFVRRQEALHQVSDRAYQMEREMEGCSHRSAPTRVEQLERGIVVSGYDPVPRCLANSLARRFPRHFRITSLQALSGHNSNLS
jgi:hypothetical protein